MSSPFSLPLNQAPTQPSLKDALDLFKKDIFLNFNCHHIVTVQQFDETKQTASATVNYKKTISRRNAETGVYEAVLLDYPLLLDMPVMCLGGASGALTFPIQAGDEGLALFNDRDLDNWFAGSAPGAVATPRLHSFADGIIIVGLRSLANVLTNYDTTRAVLRNGPDTMVGVGPALIKIANATYTLNGLLQELITEIQNLVTATAAITVTGVTAGGGTSGVPVNAAVITAINATITTTAAKIAGLLE